MQVEQLMSRSLEATFKDTTIAEAASLMRQKDIGFLPIIDGTQLVGVVTDRDLAIRGIEAGRDPDSIPVAEVMTRDVETVMRDSDVLDAVKRMKERQIQRLVVVESDGHYEGVLSLGDLARAMDNEQLVGETLREIVQPP